MAFVLSCYYIDEALEDHDLQFVQQTLLGPWARFKTGASSIEQKRVPLVLPAPDTSGAYIGDPVQRARRIKSNLRHAGIRADIGRQIVWIMPRDPEWAAIFQFAIYEETGFAPYVVQRWFPENGEYVRGNVRVVDAHMLIQGL
jgi:hypothetical protein